MSAAPPYDVFVSYRHDPDDAAWVRGQLVPRLRADGFEVCIDHTSFRLGTPIVQEMARAVEESRYTLAVLTPAYLQSSFAELENVLAEHLGLELTQRRLLCVLRAPTAVPLRMRARAWLDMTDDATFEEEAARLCDELRRDPDD